ncbi:hypothetical protein Q7C36_019578 [Tachysurus vachellii]|uniref:Uncharacterized protein n=1 Tax=Tachysurus vachellii TaxID=175792 RepID=A0AA88LXH5_TACVA|nr:hypothetical protein Q7C36_019578 [Tachysurus vachellii]
MSVSDRTVLTAHALLERQKTRITELQLQVAELRSRNARVHEEYKRHLRTCSLQQHQHNNNHNISSALTAIREKRHDSLPVETSSSTMSSLYRGSLPCRQWKSASFSGPALVISVEKKSSSSTSINLLAHTRPQQSVRAICFLTQH